MTGAGISLACNPRRSTWLARLIAFAVAGVFALHGQNPKPTEYEVEAAYLSNFAKFIDWPARAASAPNDPFYVCVLGQDPFGPLLESALKGESINGAPMAARRVAAPEDAANCRVLFMNASKDAQLGNILSALGTSAILTVSDMPGFTRGGGMIQFVIDGNRVRFEINLAAAKRAGLNLSSQLLKLAIAVRRAP